MDIVELDDIPFESKTRIVLQTNKIHTHQILEQIDHITNHQERFIHTLQQTDYIVNHQVWYTIKL